MGTIKATNIEPIADNGTVTLGSSGDTFTVPSGVTVNMSSATQTGVGGVNTPAWSVYNDSSQSVASATVTTVIFNQERFDTASAFASNTFTVPSGQGGKYFISAGIRFTDGVFGQRIMLYVNGSQSPTIGDMNYGDSSYSPDCQMNGLISFSAGDAITVRAVQNSGSSKNLEGSSDGWFRSYFMGYKIIE